MDEEIEKSPQPQEHIHERVAENMFNDLVPHFRKEVVVLQGLFQEHFQELVVEQMESFVGVKTD